MPALWGGKRATQELVFIETGVVPKKGNQRSLADVSAFHEYMERGFIGCIRTGFRLVIWHCVRVVVVADAVMVMGSEAIQCGAFAQHGSVRVAVNAEQGDAVIAESDQRGMCQVEVITIVIQSQCVARLVAVCMTMGSTAAASNMAAARRQLAQKVRWHQRIVEHRKHDRTVDQQSVIRRICIAVYVFGNAAPVHRAIHVTPEAARQCVVREHADLTIIFHRYGGDISL